MNFRSFVIGMLVLIAAGLGVAAYQAALPPPMVVVALPPPLPPAPAALTLVARSFDQARVERPARDASLNNSPRSFPWPPPKPSAVGAVPHQPLATAATLGAIAERLSAGLQAAGYAERAIYPAPGGFALVTHIEQIQDDGQQDSAESRWSLDVGPETMALRAFLRGTFRAPAGDYFRVIVFVVTDAAIYPDGSRARAIKLDGWRNHDGSGLPQAIAAAPVSPETHCAVLVYEFRGRGDERIVDAVVPGAFSGQHHVESAGVWRALGGS